MTEAQKEPWDSMKDNTHLHGHDRRWRHIALALHGRASPSRSGCRALQDRADSDEMLKSCSEIRKES